MAGVRGILTLRIDRGWGLLAIDDDPSGRQPYTCNAQLSVSRNADGSRELARTAVIDGSVNPDWDEELVVAIPPHIDTLWLTAYHMREGGEEVFIGTGALDVAGSGDRSGGGMVNMGPRPDTAAEDGEALSSPLARNRGNYGCVDLSWAVAEEAVADEAPPQEVLAEAAPDAANGDDPYPQGHAPGEGYPPPPQPAQMPAGGGGDGYPTWEPPSAQQQGVYGGHGVHQQQQQAYGAAGPYPPWQPPPLPPQAYDAQQTAYQQQQQQQPYGQYGAAYPPYPVDSTAGAYPAYPSPGGTALGSGVHYPQQQQYQPPTGHPSAYPQATTHSPYPQPQPPAQPASQAYPYPQYAQQPQPQPQPGGTWDGAVPTDAVDAAGQHVPPPWDPFAQPVQEHLEDDPRSKDGDGDVDLVGGAEGSADGDDPMVDVPHDDGMPSTDADGAVGADNSTGASRAVGHHPRSDDNVAAEPVAGPLPQEGDAPAPRVAEATPDAAEVEAPADPPPPVDLDGTAAEPSSAPSQDGSASAGATATAGGAGDDDADGIAGSGSGGNLSAGGCEPDAYAGDGRAALGATTEELQTGPRGEADDSSDEGSALDIAAPGADGFQPAGDGGAADDVAAAAVAAGGGTEAFIPQYVVRIVSVVALGSFHTPSLGVFALQGPAGESLAHSAEMLSNASAEDLRALLPVQRFESRVHWDQPLAFCTPGLPCSFRAKIVDLGKSKGVASVTLPDFHDIRWTERHDLGTGVRTIVLEHQLLRHAVRFEVSAVPTGMELHAVPDALLSALNDDTADAEAVTSLAEFFSQQRRAEREQLREDRHEEEALLMHMDTGLGGKDMYAKTDAEGVATAGVPLNAADAVAVAVLTMAVGVLILLEDDPDELLPLLTIGHEHVARRESLPTTKAEVEIPAPINEVLNTRVATDGRTTVVDDANKWLVAPFEYHCPGQQPIRYDARTPASQRTVRYIVRPPTKLDYNSPLYSNILGGAKVQRFYANLVCSPQTVTTGVETDMTMEHIEELEAFHHEAMAEEEEEAEEDEESEEGGDGRSQTRSMHSMTSGSVYSRGMSCRSRSSKGSATSRARSAFSTGADAVKVQCPSPHCGMDNFVHVKSRKKNVVKEIKYCGQCGCHLNTDTPDGVMDEYQRLKAKLVEYEKEMACMEAKIELLVKGGGPAGPADSRKVSSEKGVRVATRMGQGWGVAAEKQMEHFTGRKAHGLTHLEMVAAKKSKQKAYQRRLEKDLRHYAAHMTRLRTALYADTGALFQAAERGDVTPFAKLKRVDPEMGQLRDIVDASARTPLNVAAGCGHYGIISCVFKPINTSDPEERVQSEDSLVALCFPALSGAMSLLHSAVSSGKLALVEYLVHRFMSHPRFPSLFNVKTKANQTIMDLAHARQLFHITRYLEDQEKVCKRRKALKFTGAGSVTSPASAYGYTNFLEDDFVDQ